MEKPSKRVIRVLAEATLKGQFGNGDVRKSYLGDLYSEVQKEVNSLLDEYRYRFTPNVSHTLDVRMTDSETSIVCRSCGGFSKSQLTLPCRFPTIFSQEKQTL